MMALASRRYRVVVRCWLISFSWLAPCFLVCLYYYRLSAGANRDFYEFWKFFNPPQTRYLEGVMLDRSRRMAILEADATTDPLPKEGDMGPRYLTGLALLLLAAGCGPSAEERYQDAAQLYETEQAELDRMSHAFTAWKNSPDEEYGECAWKLANSKKLGKPAAEIAELERLTETARIAVIEEGEAYQAAIDSQIARVKKARLARDAAQDA